MLNRRTVLAALAAGAATIPAAARAQAWKAKYPEIVFAVAPAENASGVTGRFGPFLDYLSRELGTKVTLRIANDYAAVIEGQRSGNIHIGYHGPASFARARLTGVKIDAFAIDVNGDGSKGYYSVFYSLAKSPFHKLEDLKGKNLGLVDPNSASGYNMPMFALNQIGIPDAGSSSAASRTPAATRMPSSPSPRAPSMSPPTGGTPTTTATSPACSTRAC